MDTSRNETLHRANKLIKAARLNENNEKVMRRFSEYALRYIACGTIQEASDRATVPELITIFVQDLKDELEDNLQNCRLDLESALEEDAGIPEKNQGLLKPADKLKEYLEGTCGVIGYTDDILKAVSAAYGLVLEPKLY